MLPKSDRLLVAVLLGACSPSTSALTSPASTPSTTGASASHEHEHHTPGGHEHGFHKDFSDAEGFAAHFDDPARDAWQHPEAVVALMHIPPGSTVVDLGAGTGYFENALAQGVGDTGKVLALDVEPKMIEFLGRRVREQKLSNVEPRLVELDDPGLAPASVSRILIVNTWHHIDERTTYAQKLAVALAANGEVWVVDFTLDADQGPPARYRIPAEQVVGELAGGGLRAEVVADDPLPKQYIVRARRLSGP